MNKKEFCIIFGIALGMACVSTTILIKSGKLFAKKYYTTRKERKAIMPDKAGRKTREVKTIIEQAKKTLSQLEEAIDSVSE